MHVVSANSLARIGLTNSAGEVPLLIESREDITPNFVTRYKIAENP